MIYKDLDCSTVLPHTPLIIALGFLQKLHKKLHQFEFFSPHHYKKLYI